MATFQLASKYTAPLQVGRYLFTPNMSYNDTNVDLVNDLVAAAIWRGDLVFTDSTSTSEFQSNIYVNPNSLQDNVAIIGVDNCSLGAAQARTSLSDGIQTEGNLRPAI